MQEDKNMSKYNETIEEMTMEAAIELAEQEEAEKRKAEEEAARLAAKEAKKAESRV